MTFQMVADNGESSSEKQQELAKFVRPTVQGPKQPFHLSIDASVAQDTDMILGESCFGLTNCIFELIFTREQFRFFLWRTSDGSTRNIPRTIKTHR